MRWLVVVLLGLFLAGAATAQTTQSKSVDTAKLRTALSATLGSHFSIVKDELAQRSNWHGGQLFWLVHVKPAHAGHFTIKHRFKYNDPLYSHVERELRLRVGKQGCLRSPMHPGNFAKFCLGDTVILPIDINKFTEHEFSLRVTREEIDGDLEPTKQPTNAPTIADGPTNPIGEHLALIETNESQSPHRGVGGYTLIRSVTFEARKPGRFNLALTSTDTPDITTSPLKPDSFPVIVVDRATPVTGIIAHDNVTGYSIGPNGVEYASSHGGNTSYVTNVLIIQTGDRFSFDYQRIDRSGSQAHAEQPAQKSEPPAPIIHKLPFSVDNDWSYNEWIKDYLPKPQK
jgi:hypothetical protein